MRKRALDQKMLVGLLAGIIILAILNCIYVGTFTGALVLVIAVIGLVGLASMMGTQWFTMSQQCVQCVQCGYDLKAHEPGNVCPECGTHIRAIQRDVRGERLRACACVSGLLAVALAYMGRFMLTFNGGMGSPPAWHKPVAIAAAINAGWLVYLFLRLLAHRKKVQELTMPGAAFFMGVTSLAVLVCAYHLLIVRFLLLV